KQQLEHNVAIESHAHHRTKTNADSEDCDEIFERDGDAFAKSDHAPKLGGRIDGAVNWCTCRLRQNYRRHPKVGRRSLHEWLLEFAAARTLQLQRYGDARVGSA